MGEMLPRVLLSEEAIQARVDEIARRISEDHAEVDDLLLVGVLRGAFIFLADLSRRLTVPRTIDFIAVSTYGQASRTTGAVRLVMDVRADIQNRHVILVEDIVDTGYTLHYLLENFAARKPASLETCALVRKPARSAVPVPLDYLGFDIPDLWVVGYGLDYADHYRTLPYIGVIEPDEETPSHGGRAP